MVLDGQKQEKVLVLVKALPHPGDSHGETVCCAGVTADHQWRRMYPIRFRHLDAQFNRWDWVTYQWSLPPHDTRKESRRVHEESIKVVGTLKRTEQASFLTQVFVSSTDEATEKGQSLALIRPLKPRFWYEKKTPSEIQHERLANERAARQTSFLDRELKALEPCPYRFKLDYMMPNGSERHSTCGDWETSAMFRNFRRNVGEQKALAQMTKIFNEDYPTKGMAIAMGTHSARRNQWLLVGLIRVDFSTQGLLL